MAASLSTGDVETWTELFDVVDGVKIYINFVVNVPCKKEAPLQDENVRLLEEDLVLIINTLHKLFIGSYGGSIEHL